jgi:hypothetical protein
VCDASIDEQLEALDRAIAKVDSSDIDVSTLLDSPEMERVCLMAAAVLFDLVRLEAVRSRRPAQGFDGSARSIGQSLTARTPSAFC